MQRRKNSIIFSGKGFDSRIPMDEPLKVQAVLCDMDNTLLNFMRFKKLTARAAAKAMVRHGLPVDEKTAYKLIFDVYSEKGIEYNKTLFEVVKPFNLEINLAERIQQAGIAAYLRKKPQALSTYEDVEDTLERIKAVHKTGLVSDAPRNKAWQRLIMTELEDFFGIVITHDDTKEFKPHPSILPLVR